MYISIDRKSILVYHVLMQTLRELRLDANYTQKMLADLAGVTRHAVLRMEQHVYPSPPPEILKALSDITALSEITLSDMYKAEIHQNRIINGNIWDIGHLDLSVFEYDSGNLHPFRGFREHIARLALEPTSAIHFCIAFSIHPYTLSEYESFKTSYPESIHIALTEAGLPDSINTELRKSERFNAKY